jgi:signal transduction histidine kinase
MEPRMTRGKESQEGPSDAGLPARRQTKQARKDALERCVQERTAALVKANKALQAELGERKWAEQIARGQAETLAKTLNLLAAQTDLDKFVGQVLEATTEQLGAHSSDFWFHDTLRAGTYLHIVYDEGQIRPASQSPLSEAAPSEMHAAFQRRVQQTQDRKLHVYTDIAHDPALEDDRDYLLARGIRTVLRVPLFLGTDAIGTFSIYSTQDRAYRPEEIDLAQALAQQAMLASQLARMAEQSRQAAVLEERNRMAREIHDTLAQAFTGILIQLGVAQRIAGQQPEEAWSLIEHIRELARQGLTEARRSVWALQPESQQYSDLAGVLPRTVAQMTSDTPMRAEVRVHGTPRSLPSDVGMNLLRIGQEALANAIRHARARNIFVELTFDVDQVRLCVQDDGKGFKLQHQEDGGGFGLIGMRQRAERIGGKLTIASQPGRGTEVAVTAPAAAEPCREGGL